MLDGATMTSLNEALGSWARANALQRGLEAEALRKSFVERFPVSGWPNMPVESYALGQNIDGGSFCWWLEFNTKVVASMSGGAASKHLIFKGSAGEWRYPKQYTSLEEAWSGVRAGFVELFASASEGRFEEADSIGSLAGAPALRTKALYMYFPDALVPVCSRAHLHHFLRSLGDDPADLPTVAANRRLLEILRSIPGLTTLSTQQLGYFLYHWADPRSTVRVVKIAPGQQASEWADCIANSYICVGWDDVGDLDLFPTKEAFRETFREHYSYNGHEAQVSRKSNELWTLMELEPGDRVVANKGVGEVLAVGTVNETGYKWRPERARFRHTLGVTWDTTAAGSIEPVRGWATTTVSKVPAALFKVINGSSAAAPTVGLDRVYLDLEAALERRGQAVIYGPPGTGKTYTARRAAVWLLDGGSGNAAASAMVEDDAEFDKRETELSTGRSQSRQMWFMVANPKEWRWAQLFTDQSVDYSIGRLKRNYPNVRAGDLIVGYESSPTKRVVALARVTGEYDPDSPPSAALTLEPVAQVKEGVTYEELQADSILAGSEPARFRCQGTLFALTPVESDRLLALMTDRDPAVAAVAAPSIQRLTRVTFHPSYTYEDFIEGFRPVQTGNGGLELALTDGIFKRVCDAATADPGRRYVLLIDEINRGNIPKIFGELITLIENDKRGLTVHLPQSGQDFAVPSNVHLIGTMNTADRSIHLLDTALRRRFSFIELLPDSDLLEGATAGALRLDVFLDSLNEKIRRLVGREKQVGHAMFLRQGSPIDSAEAFAAVFRFELLPLLQEYFHDDYGQLAELLGSVIDVKTERVAQLADDPELLCAELAVSMGANASA